MHYFLSVLFLCSDVLHDNWQLTVLTVYVFLYGKVYLVCILKHFMIELQADVVLNCSSGWHKEMIFHWDCPYGIFIYNGAYKCFLFPVSDSDYALAIAGTTSLLPYQRQLLDIDYSSSFIFCNRHYQEWTLILKVKGFPQMWRCNPPSTHNFFCRLVFSLLCRWSWTSFLRKEYWK